MNLVRLQRSLTLPNDVNTIPQLSEFLESFCEEAGIGMEKTMSLNLALEEAVVNVMDYAYPDDMAGSVSIDARTDESTVTFVITDTEGRHALDGLVYSPRQILDEQAEALSSRIAELRHLVAQVVGTEPGYYDELLAEPLMQEMADIEHTLGSQLPADERAAQMQRLNAAYELFEQVCRTEGPILPTASTDVEEHWYSLCSSLRGSRYMHSNGAGMGLTGNGKTGSDRMMWKFVSRADGSFDIVNRADLSYISPVATYNTQVRTSAQQPSAGWTLKPADNLGLVIFTSGNVEFNQTNGATKVGYNGSTVTIPAYSIINWGSGTNTSDDGCTYAIRLSAQEDKEPVGIRLATTTVPSPFWYTLTGLRLNTQPQSPGVYITQGKKIALK